MNYIYLKEGTCRVSAFDSFIDIVHNTYNSNISDCVKPTMTLNIMPGVAFGLPNTPAVIAHSNTPTGPITDQSFLVHCINFELLMDSLVDCSFVLMAVIPPTNKVLEFEFIPNIVYIGRRKIDGVLINLNNGNILPSYIAVLPILGFYNVANTAIYCAVINENMARLPYNCDITTPFAHIKTIGREDGSLQQSIVNPQVDNKAIMLSNNIIVAQDTFGMSFFNGPHCSIDLTDRIKWWSQMKFKINTNVCVNRTHTGLLISPPEGIGYFRIKFLAGEFCDNSNDPIERFEYTTLIIRGMPDDNTIDPVLQKTT